MTLQELIRRFRVLAMDKTTAISGDGLDRLWQDEEIADWLNDAQAQAAVRARLLLEDADPAVCEVAIAAGSHTYPLHAKLYELVRLDFFPAGSTRSMPVKVVSREWLDSRYPDWREREHFFGGVMYAMQGDTRLRLAPVPAGPGLLRIEGYRLPLQAMDPADPQAAPEIHEAHHEHLVQWALHRAFSIPDADGFDARRAEAAEQAFTAYFGRLPDADLRRATRADADHVNQVHL